MLVKISRKKCLDTYNTFPLRWYNEEKEEWQFSAPNSVISFILTLPSKSFKGHLKLLGVELIRFVKGLGSDSLLFLGDNDLPWLNQVTDYKPVKEAQEYLVDNGIGRRFNGALQVSLLELPTFINHIGWLIRCNASLPYIHFVDSKQTVLGSICQYGNLHLNVLSDEDVNYVASLIKRSKLQELGDNCFERFRRTGGIKYRSIKVGRLYSR